MEDSWDSHNFSSWNTVVPKTLLSGLNFKIQNDWTYTYFLASLTENSLISALPHASKRIRDGVFSSSLTKENRNGGLRCVHQAILLIFGASWSAGGRARGEPHPASKRPSPSGPPLAEQATSLNRKLLCLSDVKLSAIVLHPIN